jgi:hypothetical protein
MDLHALLKSPALARIVEQLERFVTNDKELRRTQSFNATKLNTFGQGTEAAGTILNFPEAQTGANIYSFALLILDEASGKGRYLINDNPVGTVSGIPRGFPLPSGGYVLEISGWDNIRGFRWTNESGQTINWTYGLFI